MKFCNRFEDDLQEVGWEDHYFRYRELKEIIKVLTINSGTGREKITRNEHKLLSQTSVQSLLEALSSKGDSDNEVGSVTLFEDGYSSESFPEELELSRGKRRGPTSSKASPERPLTECERAFLDFHVDKDGSYFNVLSKFAASRLKESESKAEESSTTENKTTEGRNKEEVLAESSEMTEENATVDSLVNLKINYLTLVDFLSCAIRYDVLRVKRFVDTMVERLTLSLDCDLSKAIGNLLESSKAKMRGMEYTLRLGNQDMKTLTALGHWMDTINALERFIIVNIQAIRKIVKKFHKHSTSLLKESNNSSSRMAKLDSGIDVLIQCLVPVHTLKSKSFDLDTRIMCSSSCYHDYLQDHLKQLDTTRTRAKLVRHERQKKFSTRLTKLIDMETQIMPSFLLLLGVVLVIFTLICTYYMSMSIYVDGDGLTTVFDEKGYFISASIDRAPAANIGTLGLNLSLTFIGIAIFVKHKVVKKQLRGRVWMRTHRIACAFGMFAIFCGKGVAACQHEDLPVAHNVFAALFFTFSMLHVILETLLDYEHKLSSRYLTKLRVFIATAVSVSVVLFITPMAYLIGICGGDLCPQRNEIRFFAAVFEIAGFCCLILWFATYYPLFRALQFQLHVHRKSLVDPKSLAAKLNDEVLYKGFSVYTATELRSCS
mmetsp:Transcript_11398/g.13064  ORF Transcript_11398/g.13064 Transcript_11398/m.13064 type:complete len:659 (+) Transcript_11398:416-2392(+)